MLGQYCIPAYVEEVEEKALEEIESRIEKVEIQQRDNTEKQVKVDITFNDDSNITETKLNVRGIDIIEVKDTDMNEKVYTYTFEEGTDYHLGEVNMDSRVNSVDAGVILDIFKYDDCTDLERKLADVNYDGRINSVDAALVLDYYKFGYW